MEDKVKKLIIEIFVDVIGVIILIIATVYGVKYIFPEINQAEVVTINEYECSYKTDCKCIGKKCKCKYCLDEDCINYKNIKCNN